MEQMKVGELTETRRCIFLKMKDQISGISIPKPIFCRAGVSGFYIINGPYGTYMIYLKI